MPTAKKLPSGSWRVRVYSHKDNDKPVYMSFTAATKRDAESQAAEWLYKRRTYISSSMTVKEAIEGYIDAKEAVLSPSTIRAYRIMLKNSYTGLLNCTIQKLTSINLQLYVSDLSQTKSPKYVRNAYGLLVASIRLFEPDMTFRVTLPAKVSKRPHSPSDDDIRALYDNAPTELKKCIVLAAFGSLRRGEICALTYADLCDDVISITKDMVQASDRSWIIKDMPKTAGSIRDVRLPDKVVELLGSGTPEERIVRYKNPGSITRYFTRLRDKLGLSIRFHDLRHYFASIGAVLNVPDTYLADFGGWQRGSSVMKSVYQNNITPMSELYANKMKAHFNNLM